MTKPVISLGTKHYYIFNTQDLKSDENLTLTSLQTRRRYRNMAGIEYYDLDSKYVVENNKPMKKWYHVNSAPPPPMPIYFGADAGLEYDEEEEKTLNPIEIAYQRRRKHLRVPMTRTDHNFREVDAAVSFVLPF